LLFLIVWAVLLAPTIVPVSKKLNRSRKDFPCLTQVYLDGVGLLTILGATAVMLRFVDRRPFSSIGFEPQRVWRELPCGFAIGAGWLILSIVPLWLADWVSLQPPTGFSWSIFGGTTVALACNTITQELLGRGYILQTIQSHSNALAAALGSSLFFTLLHAATFRGEWLPALNVFLAGVLFAVAYLRTQNLWLPIGIHFAWNLLLGPVFGAIVSGQSSLEGGWHMLRVQGPSTWTGGSFGLEGGTFVTISTTITCIVLLKQRRIKISPTAAG
jgi:membrane protease YdiL (CAAX protease family)